MLNWVAILRRILALYSVRSMQDLGMALGVPLEADSFADKPIPWPILERVVAEKNASWDWLLTGRSRGETASAADNETARPFPNAKNPAPPRIETRELRRVLLDGEPRGEDEAALRDRTEIPENEAQLEAEMGLGKSRAPDVELLTRLRKLRDSMQREVDRAERILREYGGD